ncbi:hypothetical protein GCM10011507_26840 [Edaphobacter acidisoli]|uniref:TrbI/VirB10 family protein n=1 Tax=Edaphobacter acidisoli TaxID=2040573 RepID=A0A916RWV9_9BACT|nr:hypothetical protein [Edaphobacter acidisoli]GGA74111.1 hypothetical protein GCM10011507_26840 [Edaphobacter acidisoli]
MKLSHPGRFVVAITLGLVVLAGCRSQQDAALDAAKKQAAATGQPQQVVSVDKNGNTITTTVQPPVPGQTGQVVTTTVVPKSTVAANQPAVAPGQPAVVPGQPTVAGDQSYSGAQPQQTTEQVQPARPAEIDLPRGTPLAIRINEHISVKSSRPGDRFDGDVAEPVSGPDGNIVIPRGTHVDGEIVAAHKRGHFKGASILELRLTSLTLNGTQYPIQTSDYTRSKRGKGKRTAAFIGGGTGLGMLVGGLASGGTGLLIGGLAGAGAGTATGALTGNRDIEIPAESLVRFRLADDLVVRM